LISFFSLAFTNSLTLVIISDTYMLIGKGSLFPFLTLKVLDVVKPYQADKAIAIVSSLIFVGQFTSPVILDSIGLLAGFSTIRFQYGLLAVTILVFVIFSSFLTWRNKNHNASV